MKNTILLFIAITLLAAVNFADKRIITWELDKAHSTLGFSISRHFLSPVKGQVRSFNVKVTAINDDLSDAVAEMSADISSITTGTPKRDEELKGPNYFDITKFPTITFKSNSFKRIDERNYKVLGILTMHGITRPVTVEVMYTKEIDAGTNKPVMKFKSTCKIDRDDFKIGSGPSSLAIAKDVYISSETEFVKTEGLK